MSTHNFVIEKGATDVSFDVFAQDSTDGTPLTGMAYNDASLTAYYKKGSVGAITALTLATQTATGAHSDGGLVELSATNYEGVYRFDISDTIVATGNDRASIVIRGRTSLQPIVINIDLVDPINVSSGILEANVINVNGTAQTANDNGADINAILVDTGTTIPGTITTVDTVVDAIKVVTDQMVFTKANELDTNTQSINGAAVVGDGNATPWDGA